MDTKKHKYIVGFVPSLICISIIFLSFLFVSSADSRTWDIKADGTGDAPTIQAGVDSAAVGDTVLVGAGTYSDTTHVSVEGTVRPVNVCIQKQIFLLGEESAEHPLIDGINSYIGILVDSVDSTVTIGRLSLQGVAFLASQDTESLAPNLEEVRDYPASIRCYSSSVKIHELEISHANDGIFLSNSVAEVCENHTYSTSMAIVCFNGSNAEVHDNIIHDCAIGVKCENSSASILQNTIGAPSPAAIQNVGISCNNSSVCIAGNKIERCGVGILTTGGNVTIDGNIITNHDYGAEVAGCSAVISNNLFYHGWIHAIWTSSNATGEISNNTIDDWLDAGVFSELGASQLIQNNIITRISWGVVCLGSMPTVKCNDVFGVSGGLYDGPCQGQIGNGNFSADPEFCGIDDSGNYYLQSDSPCAPGNHPSGYKCGLIGALPVNCKTSPAEEKTWGNIKTLYSK